MSQNDAALKVGDKLFGVYTGFDNIEIESVVITRITPTKVWFGKSAGLAFNCRTGIPVDEAERRARSRQAAIDDLITHRREAVARAERALDAALKFKEGMTR